MSVALRASSEFGAAELAVLFTAGYEGYHIPFQVDEAGFASMVHALDLDLARSVVAVAEGEPVGLANLGLRGERTWLGGIGVVPARRRAGVGELLTRGLIERAREAGAKEMLLEVITQNEPAISLHEKLGFERVRELEVLSLPEDTTGVAAEEAPLEVALALIAARREEPEPWQREDATLAHLQGLAAVVSGDAAAVYRPGATLGLLQAAGGEGGVAEIVAALRARGPVSAVNFPAGGVVSRALQRAGATVPLQQYEMVLRL